jgi:hypothetical protein
MKESRLVLEQGGSKGHELSAMGARLPEKAALFSAASIED